MTVAPAACGERHPLTPGQLGMWFLERMSGSAVYTDPMTFHLTGPLDVPALQRALERLRSRHAALRTTFPLVDGSPVQEISAGCGVEMPVTDLRGLPAAERESGLASLLAADQAAPFDLARGPVLRALVVALGPEEHVLRLTLHHLVSDAWSWWNVLLPELAVLYGAERDGVPADLEEPAAQFPDFVRWQREWSEGPGHRRQLAYWTERLAGLRPVPLPGPASAPTGVRALSAGTAADAVATRWATVPRTVHDRLKDVCQGERVTPFMLLLAAFAVVLHRRSGATDIAVGTRAAVRSRPEFASAVGFFVNLLVIRTEVDPGAAFRDLLRDVRRGALGAYAHRELPFERVVEQLGPRRGGGFRSPVNVLFSHQSTPEVPPAFPGLTARILNHDPGTLYDIDLVFYEEDDDLRALLSHRRTRCSDEDATSLLAELTAVLAAVAEDPGIPLATLMATTGVHRAA
ncbi:condensation domain-containing protein [Streptomyces sp. PR69]|uniref:condensation domain-containing protein n=1 Tax=Streptomyces sp. PR69 TaxID=2984950 RepID=UPI002264C837|nr:condensation domain-containing protein [Streptomyces sp. PR69]